MKSRLKKQLNIIMLTLMLSLTGCSKNTPTINNSNNVTSKTIIQDSISTNQDVIYINDYEVYKEYLSELNPSYNLLRETIKKNPNITGDYQNAFLKIVDIFEMNKISTSNLAIFYENLKKEVINTNYTINKDGNIIVGAFFSPDPDTPSITVDGENVDFYLLLHEVIHSCHELMIRVDDKVLYITGFGIEEEINNLGEKTIKLYGTGFIEGQTEFLSNYLYNSSKHLFGSSKNYNNANDIIDFLYDTQSIDLNTFFAYNTNDFKKYLLDFKIPQETVDKLISSLDKQIDNNAVNGFETRKTFYINYIPLLVEQYLESGYSSKEIYATIGSSLKTSVIEASHTLNNLDYYQNYLNDQKKLFDIIDELIRNILNKHDLETYSVYDFIGHEFEIYYSLYGEETSLDNGNIYLAYNWDNVASLNSNILIYRDNNITKMCNFSENDNGSLTCYDINGEIENITNGIKLKDLTNIDITFIREGYLNYSFHPEVISEYIESLEITSDYQKESIIHSNSYLYLSDSKAVICSCTTNQEGDEIPYLISNNKVYVLPENAIKLGSLAELYEAGAITYDEYGDYNIDNDKLTSYLEEKEMIKIK